jgi:hypothetical protein
MGMFQFLRECFSLHDGWHNHVADPQLHAERDLHFAGLMMSDSAFLSTIAEGRQICNPCVWRSAASEQEPNALTIYY